MLRNVNRLHAQATPHQRNTLASWRLAEAVSSHDEAPPP